MSVKKILLLGAASVAALSVTTAMAGGFTHEPMHVADNGYYVEGHVGYARQNYFDNINWRTDPAVASDHGTNRNNDSNVRGGFSGGADLGYQINNHFGLELGWFHLPSLNVMSSTAGAASYLRGWVLYLAAKYMMPIGWFNNTSLYFKFGAAYRRATLGAAAVAAYGVTNGRSSFVRPMFAAGLDYCFTDALYGIIQYAYFMGARNSFPRGAAGPLGTVDANVFTLGLGYKFTV